MKRSVRMYILAVLSLFLAYVSGIGQPLANPIPFSFGDTVSINNTLSQFDASPAGSKGRVMLSADGHLAFADGSRFRIAGTVLQWFSAFPDSASAVRLAKRLRALGVNCVRLNTFDVTVWSAASIFANGTSTLGGGLEPEQMKRFDWFMHQLRQNGIYYVFTFQGVWTPRAEDGVIQPDSSSWGTRVPLMFNPFVQQVHRNIIRTLLTHVNPHTGMAYKDDPALAFIVAAEDASPIVYWLYTQEIVRPNTYGSPYSGAQHVALIDSMWKSWLISTYKTDAALSKAWSTLPSNSNTMLLNGGFEDPFSSVWQFFVNSTAGAQALFQYSDADKKEGSSAARIRINKLDASKSVYGLNLNQKIPVMRRQQTYELSFWAKTTPQKVSRDMAIYVYNGTSPYNSYGLQTPLTLTSTWQKYSYTFLSTSTDSTTAYVGFLMGNDSGDVFLDDVQFREVGVAGLKTGESLAKRNIPLSPLLDETITAARSKANAAFILENYRAVLQHARKLVRDTLKSQVLMCPSIRLFNYSELDAARDYEVFSNSEWRQASTSALTENSGGALAAHTQVRPKGKAFVLGFLGYQYPRPYQSEMLTVTPAYAGLQDWDGVFFSNYSETGRTGGDHIDSNNYWVLVDKPNMQALMPWTSSLVRNGAVATTTKELVLNHTRESAELPRLHVQSTFNLSVPADSRIPLFRKTSVNLEFQTAESLLPQLEVSALSGDVDLAALDAENEQIYFDQTTSTMRIVTPTHVAVTGPLGGRIVTAGNMSVEQTAGGPNAVVALHSLTGKPLDQSTTALLTISTRCANNDAKFKSDGSDFSIWGKGPVVMESAAMRISIASKRFDSLTIIPLGSNGQPLGTVAPITTARNAAGKFVVLLNMQTFGTPWYRLEYGISTGVQDELAEQLTVSNPVRNDVLVANLPTKCDNLRIVSSLGGVVRELTNVDGRVTIDTHDLVQGAYFLVARAQDGTIIDAPFVITRD